MSRKPLPVAQLQFGMYIAELDRPWTDTPFMFQGFYLRTEQQLQALRRLCGHVFIDFARSEAGALHRMAVAPAAAAAPGFRIQGAARYPEVSSVRTEIKAAGTVFEQSLKALKDLFRPLEAGSAVLDAVEVRASVNRLAQSVVRNPDALLLMSTMREQGVAAHARALQVSIYMMVFARFLQLERDEIELLGLLGLLQDIGKTRLPSSLLEKQGPLSAEESEMVKKHVELSAHILGATPGLPPRLAALSLLHHERQDGTGYPRGLKAYQIGLYGSIAAICDAFDALMAVRPYAVQRSPSAAMNILLKERGTAFHAQLVEQFIQCVGAFPVGSVVELNSGEVGIVVAENRLQRLKPRVVVVVDSAGKRLAAPKMLDLAEKPYRVRKTLEHGTLDFDPRELLR
jgi:HD-GYP domain-containing protein (c-di-GMP phosphodiesterase class II)